jgi:hypothetical protein
MGSALQIAAELMSGAPTKAVVVGKETYRVTHGPSTIVRLRPSRPAVGDLRAAVQLARPQADPALFLRSAATLLELDGDDQLAAEAPPLPAGPSALV